MKVAATQFAPKWKAFDANLRSAMTLVDTAAKHGAQLVVLPELCTTGYSFLSEDEARPFAEVLSDAAVGPDRIGSFVRMRKLARALNVGIAWGLIEEDPGTRSLYNSQALVLPDGRWSSVRKLNRWGNDYIWSTAGTTSPPVIEYLGKRIGLLICADVADRTEKLEELYGPGDADVVAFSANWGDGGFPAGKWVRFATSNRCHLVVSNRYGQEENNNFGEGGVCVIAPSGKVHVEGLRWNLPCIVYAEV